MSTAVQRLIDQGWPVTEEHLAEIFGSEIRNVDYGKLYQLLLNADFRNYSVDSLFKHVDKAHGLIKGKIVLQISKVRDVSQPKQRATIFKDGLLKITLTDGHSNLSAVQLHSKRNLNSKLLPGTKIYLKEDVKLECGLAVIDQNNVQVLGGTVLSLVDKWNLERGYGDNSSRKTTSAPKWIHFSNQSPSEKTLKVDLSVNDVIKNVISKPRNENNEEFVASRKANIEQAVSNIADRKFAPSKLKQQDTGKDHSFKEGRQKKEPKGRRRRGKAYFADEEETQHESGPIMLSDFLQLKTSTPNHVCSLQHSKHCSPYSQTTMNREKTGNTLESLYKESSSNVQRKGLNQGSALLHPRNLDSKTSKSAQANRSRSIRDDFSNITISSTPKRGDSIPGMKGDLKSNASRFDNKRYTGNSDKFSRYNFSSNRSQYTSKTWENGEACLAPWEDGQLYEATIISIGLNGTCTIEFNGYGEQKTLPSNFLVERM